MQLPFIVAFLPMLVPAVRLMSRPRYCLNDEAAIADRVNGRMPACSDTKLPTVTLYRFGYLHPSRVMSWWFSFDSTYVDPVCLRIRNGAGGGCNSGAVMVEPSESRNTVKADSARWSVVLARFAR